MERVLHQSWQWIRAWVPPGITAIGLVITMIGLWLVMTDPDRSLFTREQASITPAHAEHAADTRVYRPAASTGEAALSTPASETSPANLAQATPAGACEALRKEIDSAGVRVRAAGKSKQGARFRTRLRELRQRFGEECQPDK